MSSLSGYGQYTGNIQVTQEGTQPGIAALIGDTVLHHVVTRYFIICEEIVLLKTSSLNVAHFLMVAAYYCYNLEYSTPAKGILSFFQDCTIEQLDSNKKSASYLHNGNWH